MSSAVGNGRSNQGMPTSAPTSSAPITSGAATAPAPVSTATSALPSSAVTTSAPFGLGVVGEPGHASFTAVQQQNGMNGQGMFSDRPDAQNALGSLGGASATMFLQEDPQQQQQQPGTPQQSKNQAPSGGQQQIVQEQLQRQRKEAFQQGQEIMQARQQNPNQQQQQQQPQIMPQGEREGMPDEYLRREQQFSSPHDQQERNQQSQQMQQGAPNARAFSEEHRRNQRMPGATFGQREQNPQQRDVQQSPGGMRVVSPAGAAAEAFNAAQAGGTTVPGTQFTFDAGETVRGRRPGAPANQHPAVVLGFSDNYIPQQDAVADSRARQMTDQLGHQAREFQTRFEGDPAAMVGPGMAYEMDKAGELDPSKRMATVAQEAAIGPASLDPNLQMGRTVTPVKREGDPRMAAAMAQPYVTGTVEKRIECEDCGQMFGDGGSLKRHQARSHRAATGKGPVSCYQCNALLKNDQNLRRHIAVCHSGDQENACDMCSASFSSRGSLRIHQQQVHAVPGQPKPGVARNGRGGAVVRGGGAATRVGGRPRGAGISKSGKSDKSYVCDMCTDTFKWKGNLKRHRELRHLQLRPFQCEVCQASFGTKSNMRVHLITHTNPNAQK